MLRPALLLGGGELHAQGSGAAVAVGWSQYVNQLLFNLFGFQIPDALAYAPEEGGIEPARIAPKARVY